MGHNGIKLQRVRGKVCVAICSFMLHTLVDNLIYVPSVAGRRTEVTKAKAKTMPASKMQLRQFCQHRSWRFTVKTEKRNVLALLAACCRLLLPLYWPINSVAVAFPVFASFFPHTMRSRASLYPCALAEAFPLPALIKFPNAIMTVACTHTHTHMRLQ